MFYSVDIQAIVKECFEIEADSLEEAKQKAEKEYKEEYYGEVVLIQHLHVEELPSAIEGDV